jgi:hypothetical protein
MVIDIKEIKPSDIIHVKATLKVTEEELKKRMSAFPFAKQVEGDWIKYKIYKSGKEKSDMMLLECTKEGVSLSFYYDEKSKPGKTLNLLRFMSLLAYLKGIYEVVLDELYGQIVESISYAAVIGYKPYIEIDEAKTHDLLDSLGKSNLALSNRVMAMESSQAILRDKIAIYEKFAKDVIDRFSMKGNEARSSADMLGVDSELRDKIVAMLSKKQ